MSYPGNESLSPEIQHRILTTFKQTVSLAGEGSRQEALLGCDFILRLDPLFEPARTLYNRLQASEGAVEIDDLLGIVASVGEEEPGSASPDNPAASQNPSADAAAQADDLFESELPQGEAAVATEDLAGTMSELLEQRQFQQINQLAKEHRAAIAADPALKGIVDTVSQRLEAQPYIRSFIDSANKAREQGNLTEAQSFVDKAKNLDATHPEVVELDATITAATSEPGSPAVAEPVPLPAVPEPEVGTEVSEAVASSGAAEAVSFPVVDEPAAAPEAGESAPPLVASEPVGETVAAEPAATAPAPESAPPLVASEPVGETAAAEPAAATPAPEAAPPPAASEPAEGSEVPEATPGPAAASEATEAADAPSIDLPEGAGLDHEPSASLDPESEARVAELLKEGQSAYDRGEYQTAIDAWSRIFLIEIDHPEANRRIEMARKLKEELERKVEEAFHDGISRLEKGQLEEATEAFKKVLHMQPNHVAAKEYLQKIESGEVEFTRQASAQPEAEAPSEDLLDTGGLTSPDTPIPPPTADAEAIEVDAEAVPARGPITPEKKGAEKSRARAFTLVGISVLLLVVVGGWMLFSKRSQFFPNWGADMDAAGGSDVALDPITRARQLHEQGRTPIAIAQLRRLPPDDPQYAEAQALIALWEIGQKGEDTEAEGPSPEELAAQKAVLERARGATEIGDNLLAWKLLERAEAIAPLEGDGAQLKEDTRAKLEILKAEWDLFRQGDWEYAIPSLWRLYQDQPDNRDVRKLIVDSYFNLGVRDLQRGDPSEATKKFGEALNLRPDDLELQRLSAFAETYRQRRTDLLYRIFVKYHPFRS